MKKHPLTQEQREQAAKYLDTYQTLLNLRDWRITMSDKPAQKGAMADVRISLEDHLATVSIGSDWGQPATDEMVRQTVIHELLHVFLRPLMDACTARDERAIEAAEHSAIVVLERLL
jgi:hypothetical protein